MKKEVYFQWLIKSVPNASVVALAQAAALQVASKKTVVYSLSTLLNVSTAVHALATAPQVQSKLNNSVLKKGESFWLTFFPFQKNFERKNSLIPARIRLFIVLLFYCFIFSPSAPSLPQKKAPAQCRSISTWIRSHGTQRSLKWLPPQVQWSL